MVTRCAFDGCDRDSVALGYCPPHYRQYRSGKELKPIRHYNTVQDGKKVCTVCNENKPVSEFYDRLNPVSPGVRALCIECDNLRRLVAYRRTKVGAA